ncbi:MAG TPA: hypothetical protein VLV87_02000 [Gammaproteobacteria bacterium]|nr:hypothetical protein [Gammaproteobacteria bacterium]
MDGKGLVGMLLGVALLGGCSMTEQNYLEQPDQYGLYVARINIYMDNTLQIRNDQTGEVIAVQIHLYGRPGAYGYLETSLKPGRYHIYDYRPFKNVIIPMLTDTGYFDVQAGCFNYGGDIVFATPEGGRINYSDSVDLTALSDLPGPLAKQAESGRDICSAPLGKPNQRFSFDSVKATLSR